MSQVESLMRIAFLFIIAWALALSALYGWVWTYSDYSTTPPLVSTSGGTEASKISNPQLVANYDFRLNYNPVERKLAGTEKLSWTNASTIPVQKLFFHLYLNAFEGPNSIFLRTSKARDRWQGSAQRWGGIEVSHISSPRFPKEILQFEEEGAPDDNTQVSLRLPAALAPGQSIELNFEFVATLPTLVERTGVVEDFHFFGQFFPKIAKLEKNGEFASFDFHSAAEFYADFGNYSLELTAPSLYQLAAPGLVRTIKNGPQNNIYRVEADRRIDFAFALGKGLQLSSRTFNGVQVDLFRPKNSHWVEQPSFSVIESGLNFFARELYPYPDNRLVVLYVPEAAEAAGGMEYPGLITTTSQQGLQRLGVRKLEWVTIHELGHQYFQSMIATNEALIPFLDESLTSLYEARFLQEHYGNGSLVSTPLFEISRQTFGRRAGRRVTESQILGPAKDFQSFEQLAQVIYGRAPLILMSFRNLFGAKKFDRAMKNYALSYRFKHPTIEDLFAILAKEYKPKSLNWLKAALRNSKHYSVRIDSVTLGDLETTEIRLALKNTAGLPLSLDVECTDHTTLHYSLDQFSQTAAHLSESADHLSIVAPCRADEVQLDKKQQFLLDEQLFDNIWSRKNNPSRLISFFKALAFQQLFWSAL